MQSMNDRKIIENLGGATKVAKLLNYDLEKGGAQKVHNWITRGIPPKVKLEFPNLFLRQYLFEEEKQEA